MLTLYHAEPGANSLKCLIPLFEKALPFESSYVDLHKFEQHEAWFVAINPEGQVPVLDHDGQIITQTTVINEYLEDAFPDAPALRPADPLGVARMRYWNKFVDEHVMNSVSMWGWHRFVGVLARGIESGDFDRMVERIPLHEQREKWRTARSGFSEADLANAKRKVAVALDKVEAQLGETSWLAGDSYTLADINFYAHCGMYAARMFPDLTDTTRHPRLAAWRDRIADRPAVGDALAMPDHTNPALRTFTGEVH
ncbi:glutathione S-transferase family protein [Sphingobium sp. AR-3-1]|uniref:Glutathione S-transferase family protein n=1 Tax=Sphingobium psychrophilum TaxID=2728834 RepID=A0A7X9WT45_9SPHN|nr:glutathione S-transferase family protein [Sphingobium psychrophilum]NML09379.1 glutathione S-transferase family protein [Sphingobium psychrophilum]